MRIAISATTTGCHSASSSVTTAPKVPAPGSAGFGGKLNLPRFHTVRRLTIIIPSAPLDAPKQFIDPGGGIIKDWRGTRMLGLPLDHNRSPHVDENINANISAIPWHW